MLTEVDSALKVTLQITFWGLVAYKPVAYKKVCIGNKHNAISWINEKPFGEKATSHLANKQRVFQQLSDETLVNKRISISWTTEQTSLNLVNEQRAILWTNEKLYNE